MSNNLSASTKGSLNEQRICKAMNGTPNTAQRVGVGHDFTIEEDGNTYKVEVKFDGMASKFNSFYVEFQQTFDGGSTWKPSGLFLSDCDIIVFSSLTTDYYVDAVKLTSLLANNKTFARRRTRPGVNGNRANSFSEGIIVPVTEMEKISIKVESNDLANYFASAC